MTMRPGVPERHLDRDAADPPIAEPARVHARSFAWGFVSQGASSLTTLVLSVAAGRALGPDGLGAVFIGFTTYLLTLVFQRALISDPLVASTAAASQEARDGPTRAGLTLAATTAILVSLFVGAIAVLIGPPFERGLLLFAPWMVPALIQDFAHTVLFRDDRGALGALSDTAWLLT